MTQPQLLPIPISAGGPITYLLLAVGSFAVSYLFSYFLVPRLKRAGITGNDVNKPDKPEVAEMGGFSIIAGFTAGVLLAVFFNVFFSYNFDLIRVLAALITIHSIAFIGVVDDLISIPQRVKAFLPLFAAIPLVAVKAAGSTAIMLPFIGVVDFGLLYIIALIPLGVAVASNLTNMLAGFNGMEVGMGSVIFAAMALLAFNNGSVEMLVLFVPMLGALLGFLPFNLFPARVFPGDVGNLSIGAVLAAGVIIGNMEGAGAFILSLYIIDFFIKLKNRFPSRDWWGEIRTEKGAKAGGSVKPESGVIGSGVKLYPVGGKVRGFAQLVMKLHNGITEKRLVACFVAMQIVVAMLVLLAYWK